MNDKTKKILILYATLTGNTQFVSEKIMEHLWDREDIEAELLSATDILDLNLLKTYDLIIFGTSSWGEEDYNPDAEEFFERLENENFDFERTKFSFFGLGDSSYEVFCGASNRAERELKDKYNIKK